MGAIGRLTGNAANQCRHHMYPFNRSIRPFCSIPEEHNVHDEYTIFDTCQRKFKAFSGSGFQAVDSGFQLADFLSVELGFRIPKLWIPDSKSKISRILPGLTLKIISTSKKGIRIITLISGIGLLCGL